MTTQGPVHSQESPSADGESSRGTQQRSGKPLLHYFIELIELEVQLVTLRCARIARDALVQACVIGGAVVALLVGVIFLYIGIFLILEDFLRVWQICVLFAVVHLLIGAGILLSRGKFKAPTPPPGDSHVDR